MAIDEMIESIQISAGCSCEINPM